MAGAVNCRQSAARGLATLGLRQWKPSSCTLIRIRGIDSSTHYSCYYPIRKQDSSSRCRVQKFEMCHGRFFRHISTTSWTTPVCVWHQNKRQIGVENYTAADRSPSLVARDLPCSQFLPSGSLRSACIQGTHPGDVHLQSLVCIPDQKISMQVIVHSQGREQAALVEKSCAGMEQLVASRIESGACELEECLGAEQARALLLSHLLDSITTVDGRSTDDIAVEHRSMSDFHVSPVSEPAAEGIPETLAGSFAGAEVPTVGRPASLKEESLDKVVNPWDVSEGHLDSFRTLFDSECCRVPYHAGLEHLTVTAPQLRELAFRRAGELKSTNPQKGEPSMEEHLAVLYEKLRQELPNFFLKPHDYEMYSRDVEFISAFPRIKIQGRSIYRVLVTLSRFIAWNYCADLQMEVMKMTQHLEDWTVQVRWRVTGIPLHVLILRFYKKDKTELYRTYDAYSIFYLGPDGLVHRHKVSKMIPTQPPIAKVKRLLIGALVALGLEEHRPALNFLFAQLADKVGQKQC
ncbi:uncharacterized protein C6orf136 homolog [Pristis pectinata]|uniref:uncharacterized protein C6orf136 homolog n=1 Tax=Pristis pectinata TaxID=685728 RepID=UPI00223D86D6|nr:uncharacterized protein C6orf136 homolog [Pristis pectinata]